MKKCGKGVSIGYLSIFSQFDVMGSNKVNMCQLLALF